LAETLEEMGQGKLPIEGVQNTFNERKHTQGNFSKQADTAQELKTALHRGLEERGVSVSADQLEAMHMICSKMSRIIHGNPNEPDHWRDIAGYATLIENTLVHGRSHLG
jgi:hypothetical protein